MTGLRRILATALSTCVYRHPCRRSQQYCRLRSSAGFGPRTSPACSYCTLQTSCNFIRCHQLHPHAYADDTQIYGFGRPYEADALQLRLSACVDDVSLWMTSNRLQLNPAKTGDSLHGVRLLGFNSRFQLVRCVSATHLYVPSQQFEILEST